MMDVARILAATAISSFFAFFTDWLFFRTLFRDRYQIHPEVWRTGRKDPYNIMASQMIGVIACAGFVAICYLYPPALRIYLKAAVFVWLAGALPVMIHHGLWIKLHPLTVASQAVGWLARLVITAFVCSLVHL